MCTLTMPVTLMPVIFLRVLDKLNLDQNVAFATHSASHTLDLVNTHRKGIQVTNVDLHGFAISDHIAVSSTIRTNNKPTAHHEITYRKTCSLAYEELKSYSKSTVL